MKEVYSITPNKGLLTVLNDSETKNLQLCFDFDKSSSHETKVKKEATIIEINTICQLKRKEIINSIINNTPSF